MKTSFFTVISMAVITTLLYSPIIHAQSKKMKATQRFVFEQSEFKRQWKEVQKKFPLVSAALKESTLLNLNPKQIRGRKQLTPAIDSRVVGIQVDPEWRANFHSCVAFLTGLGGVPDSCGKFVDPPRCFCPPPLICLQAAAGTPEHDACFNKIEQCEERCLEGSVPPQD